MGSLFFGFSYLSLQNPNPNPRFRSLPVRSGLRGAGTRRPLWRSAVMSSESIQAVQALKLASKSASPDGRVEAVLERRIGRLIKVDLMSVLAELQRQNEWRLALQVFDFIRKEEWYRPDLSLYSDMIFMLGRNKLIDMAEELFHGISKEGSEPNSRAYTEIIGSYLQVDRLDKAMDMYKLMKDSGSGCLPTELTFTILIRHLEKSKEHDLVLMLKKDCEEILENPEKFLEEVGKTYPKRRKFKVV